MLRVDELHYLKDDIQEAQESVNSLDRLIAQFLELKQTVLELQQHLADIDTSSSSDAFVALQTQVAELATLADALTHQFEDKFLELHTNQNTLQTALNTANQSNTAALTTIRDSVAQLNADISSLNEQLHSLSALHSSDLSTLRNNLTLSLSSIVARIDSLETKITQATADMTSALSSIDNLQHTTTLLDTRLTTVSSSISTANNNIATIKQEQIAQNSSIQQLADDLHTANSSIVAVNSNVSSLNTKLDKAVTDITKLTADTSNLSDTLADTINAATDLASTVNALDVKTTSVANTLQTQITNNANRAATLTTSLSETNAAVASLETSHSELEEYARESRRLLGTQATTIDRLNTTATNITQDLTDVASEVTAIQQSVETNTNDVTSLKADNTTNKNDITTIKQEQIIQNTNITNLQNNKWQIGGTYTNPSSQAALTLTSEDNPCYFEWKSSNKKVLAIGRNSSDNKDVVIQGNTVGWNNTQALNISDFTWLNITCPVSYSQPIKTSSHIKTGAGKAGSYIAIWSDQIDMVKSANSASFIAWAPKTGDGTRGNVYAKIGLSDNTNNLVISGNDGGWNNQLFISHWGKVNIRNNVNGVAIAGPIMLSGDVSSAGPITSTGKVTMNGGAALNGTVSVGSNCPDLSAKLTALETRLATVEAEINSLRNGS